jgi:hypothetical protein
MREPRKGCIERAAVNNPKLRQAALFALYDHWGLSETLLPTFERMLREERDDTVRGMALLNLTDLYRDTDDKRIGSLLAAFVRDKGLPIGFRTSAYSALYGLRGLSSDCWPRTYSPEWKFPDNVDWSFVDSFGTQGTARK